MDKKRIRITVDGFNGNEAKQKIIRAVSDDVVKVGDDVVFAQIDSMNYDDMKLASRLSANLINGVRVVPDTDSPAVNALLQTLKERDRNFVGRATQYINRAIVSKNESDNKPSVDAKMIYKEMMGD